MKTLRMIVSALIGMSLLIGGGKKLTIEDVVGKSPFEMASLGKIVWVPDKDAYVFWGENEKKGSLFELDLMTGDTSLFVDSSHFEFDGERLQITEFSFDRSGSQVLLQTDRKKIWRHSHTGTYYVLNLNEKKIIPVSRHNTMLRNVKFSPNGKWVAYVRQDNNLYAFEIGKGKEKRLTRSGSEAILNGHFGWVYEEEFSGYDAYRWSPDSKMIAYWEEDQSDVPLFTLIDELQLYPTIRKIRYPKAGQTNPTMRIGVVKVRSGAKKWMDIGDNHDAYYPRMFWDTPERLVVMRLNRHQNKWVMFITNPKTGKSRVGLTEEDPDGWVEIHDNYRFLDDGEILWVSERSGYYHLFRHKNSGELVSQLTRGKWEVTRIVHVDEKGQKVYFMANKESTLERHFYSINFDGSGLTLLTPERGVHLVRVTPTGRYFIDTYSSVTVPPRIVLREVNGALVRVLEETALDQFLEYDYSYPEFVQFRTTDQKETLDGILTLPPDYDGESQYPVIVHGYGMPGTQIVWNRWGGIWNQFLAQNGFIVFSMDARGMSGRGEAFKNLSYGDMSRYLAKDHVAGINYLIREGYADPGRIGAWGWSGGGYFAGLMLTRNGPYFRAGVAVAPVTDFRLYDTIYTERSMGLPQENQAGYDSTSVLSYVDRVEGNLLVIHGTGDDNVHDQNTVQLVEAFVKANKPIDVFFYPNRAHGIRGGNARIHLYTKMFDYFATHLQHQEGQTNRSGFPTEE